MISLKKESSVGEITPVHLMSEEEAGEKAYGQQCRTA